MKNNYIYVVIVVLLVGGLILVRNGSDSERDVKVTAFDSLASCLADAGAIFYGAYWCPNCQDQKKLFDNSKKVPYVECSTPSGDAQTQECADKEIKSYPTWEFLDGTRLEGVRSLDELASVSGCKLPE